MAETHCGGRYQFEQAFASRSFMRGSDFMLQIPFGYSPGTEIPPPSAFERFAGFMVLYFVLLSFIGFILPLPWFKWCFRTLFPFVPERIGEHDDD